ncbi:hypothetical protein D3C76_1169160 [compost metagenome]
MGDLLHHVGGVVHVQAHPAVRLALHEAADQQGGQVVADGQGGAEVQRAEGALAVEQVLDFPAAVEQRHSLGQQLAAEGVEGEALAGAVEQPAVELPLQFAERGAGGRLRHRQRLGGAGDAFLLGHRDEHFQLAQGEFHGGGSDREGRDIPSLG